MIKFLFLIIDINCEKIYFKVENPLTEKVLMEKISPTEYNWYFYFKDRNHLHLITLYEEKINNNNNNNNNYEFYTKSTKIYHLFSHQHECPVIIDNLTYKKYKQYMREFKD
jgi:hypothetical protein